MAQECATDKDDGPKNPLSELMDLSETRAQVDGPTMHLTLSLYIYIYMHILYLYIYIYVPIYAENSVLFGNTV